MVHGHYGRKKRESKLSDDNKTELEIAGMKFTGGKMFLVISALSTLAGGAWGAFEFYNDYRNMKAQIQEYVAPDLSGLQEQLSVMDANMNKLQELLANDEVFKLLKLQMLDLIKADQEKSKDYKDLQDLAEIRLKQLNDKI